LPGKEGFAAVSRDEEKACSVPVMPFVAVYSKGEYMGAGRLGEKTDSPDVEEGDPVAESTT
jgi:hypothetical protein